MTLDTTLQAAEIIGLVTAGTAIGVNALHSIRNRPKREFGSAYSIKLETSDKHRYPRAIEAIEQSAISNATDKRKNSYSVYILKDGGTIKIPNKNASDNLKVIEATSDINPEMLNRLNKILYN